MSEAILLLGIDTSGSAGSLALVRTDGDQLSLLGRQELTGRNFSAEFIPRLRELLGHADVNVQELNAIMLVHGPGSFTGLRIGISAAKALAEACAIPILSISRLALLQIVAGKDRATVLDAGRGEYYLRLPSSEAESLETLSSLVEKTRGAEVCICEPQLAGPLAALHPAIVRTPEARDAIEALHSLFLAQAFDDVATLDANYVRRPYPLPAKPVAP